MNPRHLPNDLLDLQHFGLDLTVDPYTARRTLVHEWDATAARRVERWLDLTPREAMAAGHTVCALYPTTTVTIDLDAPDRPVDGVPAAWQAAERAASRLGLTVMTAPSGTVRHGISAQTGVVVAHTDEHARGFIALLEHLTGVRGLARAGCRARTLGGWRDKPTHAATYGAGGVLGPDGVWQKRSVAELRIIASTPSSVPAAQVQAILHTDGAVRRPENEVRLPDGDGSIAEMTAVLARPRSGGRTPLLDVALTDGAGYNPDDPASRHQGEQAVIGALVRAGYGVAAIKDFLAAHPIGDRMRAERREDGRVVRRSDRGQYQHVQRAVQNAARLVADSGGARRVHRDGDEDVMTVVTAAWVAPVSHATRVAAAVVMTRAVQEGRLEVAMGQLDLELLTGMDGSDAMTALRAHPDIDEVVPGTRDGDATVWRITAPATPHPPLDLHAPGWDAVAEAASSPVVAGGGLGRTHRAHTALVLAALRDRALTRRQVAAGVDSTPARVGRVLQRTADACLTAPVGQTRHRLVAPLWVGAMATGTAEHTERARGKVAERRARRRAETARLTAEAAARAEAAAGDPGVARPVLEDDVVLAAGDPRAALAAAWLGDADAQSIEAIPPGLTALLEEALTLAGGDLAQAQQWIVEARDATVAWADTRPAAVPAPAVVLAVGRAVLTRLAEVGGLAADDLTAVIRAGAAATARITWPELAAVPTAPAAPEPDDAVVVPLRRPTVLRPVSDPDALVDDGDEVVDPLAVWDGDELSADAA